MKATAWKYTHASLARMMAKSDLIRRIRIAAQLEEMTMGADIYLRSVNDKAKDEWQPKFDEAVRKRDELIEQIGKQNVVYNDGELVGPPEVVEAQKKVSEAYNGLYSSGYFRDSYNDTSLFWMLDLSWWKLSDDLSEDGTYPVEKAKELLKRFEEGDAVFNEKTIRRKLKETDRFNEDGTSKHEGGSTLDEWVSYYRDKHKRWIDLLKQSIELNEPLYWSV
jgi:hypothetical protein